jgi:hypothetical protein
MLFENILRIIIGFGLMICGGMAGIAWLGFCFGSVIIGILLLIFAPQILLLPFLVAGHGISLIQNGANTKQPYNSNVNSDSVWNKSSKNLESISELIEKKSKENKNKYN